MAQLAIDMDQNGPEHPLQGEEAYFDGCHSRCVGYKTLALFYITRPCIVYLGLQQWRLKVSPHMKLVFSGSYSIKFSVKLRGVTTSSIQNP